MCPVVGEYRMLMEFHNHMYRVYFPLRGDKVILDLSKLLKIPNPIKFLKKNVSVWKWKILEAELERNKSQHGSLIKRYRLVTFDIFDLVLFPSLMSVISFEVVVAFVEYENTQVNPIATILDETILTLIHRRKLENGQSDVTRSYCIYGW